MLLQAWETAARQLGDVGIDLDREPALLYYARHFDLDNGELDHHGMLRQLVQGALPLPNRRPVWSPSA